MGDGGAVSECKAWRSAADLLGAHAEARVGVLGATLAERSLTPGRCDLAPAAVRAALKRMSVYDLETGTDLAHLRVNDAGDLDVKVVSPGTPSSRSATRWRGRRACAS